MLIHLQDKAELNMGINDRTGQLILVCRGCKQVWLVKAAPVRAATRTEPVPPRLHKAVTKSVGPSTGSKGRIRSAAAKPPKPTARRTATHTILEELGLDADSIAALTSR